MIVKIIAAVIGAFLVLVILQDGFESVVLPRKVSRKFRFTRIFYVGAWNAWSLISRRIKQSRRREMFLSYYGPLSLILLLGIWAIVLIFGYTLLQWGADTALQAPEKSISFGSYLYMSGVIFTTLGFGDVVPLTALGRTLAILEAGTGFAFLALIIGYVPVIYQAFSRREVGISQLDARAGSPSSPTELLLRHVHDGDTDGLTDYLHDWEI
ncbi:MAG: two pore domain potassium channel family protein [Ktedonobacteraceae bacterium]|nr:two pore domain potassium channel family protein [Ktedonobacteraceae bacterium]